MTHIDDLAVDTTSEPEYDVARDRRHRARWWPVVVAALTVIVAAALIAGGVWVAHYQPLVKGSGFYSMSTTSSTEVRHLDNIYGTDFRMITPQPGDEFVIMFGIYNSGPLAVTIDQIQQPFNFSGTVGDPSSQDSTSVGTVSLATDPRAADFHELPVTLTAGQNAQVRITFNVLDCATIAGEEGGLTGSHDLNVDFRLFGVHHTTRIDVGAAYSAEALPHCPFGAAGTGRADK